MSDRSKSVIFAFVLCTVISILLTGASTGLQRFQEKNILIDRQRNILRAIGLIEEDRKYSADAVTELYKGNVRAVWADPLGNIIETPISGEQDLPIYLYEKDGAIEAYVIPINSRGLWGRIMGYLAMENDGSTISGFTVYKHSETPGLGGEIENSWFQRNFIGKKIIDREGNFVSISIAKGKASDRISKADQLNFVDGISGATLTGKYLTAGMKQILKNYEPVSIRFRKNLVQRTSKGS